MLLFPTYHDRWFWSVFCSLCSVMPSGCILQPVMPQMAFSCQQPVFLVRLRPELSGGKSDTGRSMLISVMHMLQAPDILDQATMGRLLQWPWLDEASHSYAMSAQHHADMRQVASLTQQQMTVVRQVIMHNLSYVHCCMHHLLLVVRLCCTILMPRRSR